MLPRYATWVFNRPFLRRRTEVRHPLVPFSHRHGLTEASRCLLSRCAYVLDGEFSTRNKKISTFGPKPCFRLPSPQRFSQSPPDEHCSLLHNCCSEKWHETRPATHVGSVRTYKWAKLSLHSIFVRDTLSHSFHPGFFTSLCINIHVTSVWPPNVLLKVLQWHYNIPSLSQSSIVCCSGSDHNPVRLH